MDLKRLSIFGLAQCLFMLLLGYLLVDSGQSQYCTSWPLCLENDYPNFHVYAHRAAGMFLGLFSIYFLFKIVSTKRKDLYKSGFMLVFLILLEGLVGAVSAFYHFPKVVKVTHLVFTYAIVGILIFIFIKSLNIAHLKEKFSWNKNLKDLYLVGTILVFIQSISGALVRHSQASLSCAKSAGKSFVFQCYDIVTNSYSWWPVRASAKINLLHRYFFVITLLYIFWIYFKVRKESNKKLSILNLGMIVVLVGQAVVGPLLSSQDLPQLLSFFHLINALILFSCFYGAYNWAIEVEIKNYGKALPSTFSDILDLFKPRLASLVMLTVLFGILLVPGKILITTPILALLLVFLVVGSAASLNCYIEKDVDALMERTKDRPLAAKRLKAKWVLVSGGLLFIVAEVALYFFINPVTAVLGAIAHLLYICAYTPMKRISPLAVYVGAIPGAIPPVMGVTAITGSMDTMAWILFTILFIWQIPHFFAISIYNAKDYLNAKIQVYPNLISIEKVLIKTIVFTVLLVISSFLPYFYKLASMNYFWVAFVLGLIFILISFVGVFYIDKNINKWARFYFLSSVIYLPLICTALVILR